MSEKSRWSEPARNAIAAAVVSGLLGLAGWFTFAEVRFAKVEGQIATNVRAIERLDEEKASKEAVRSVQDALTRIDAKLDAILLRPR